jgi:hypothetical protein
MVWVFTVKYKMFRQLVSNTRAQTSGASAGVNVIVGLVVAGLMAAFLLPIAIEEISNVSTAGWGDGAASLWNVMPIMIVLAIFLFFTGLALNQGRGS